MSVKLLIYINFDHILKSLMIDIELYGLLLHYAEIRIND